MSANFKGDVNLVGWEFNLPDWIKPDDLLKEISDVITCELQEEAAWIYYFPWMYGNDDAGPDDASLPEESTAIRLVLPLGESEDGHLPELEISLEHCIDQMVCQIEQGAVPEGKRLRDDLRALAQRLDDAVRAKETGGLIETP